MALPRSRRAGAGQLEASAEPGLRAEPAALPGRIGAARPQEFRLRQLARARAVGAAAVRLPRDHRAEFRGHLLQQLLQERPAADRADRAAGRSPVQRHVCVQRLPADDRPRRAGRARGRRPRVSVRDHRVPQVLPAERLRRHRPHAAPRGQDPPVRSGAAREAAVAQHEAGRLIARGGCAVRALAGLSPQQPTQSGISHEDCSAARRRHRSGNRQ
ncbi:hypothetical protein F01_420500 [Burkholderia cenocepacia]|nr:hypothetical protein F01_420500 [Burkholderia cenocepacia]